MKYEAKIFNGDYLGSEKIMLDFPCEIHFTRFGKNQHPSILNRNSYSNIYFDNRENFKVFVCSNEPKTSANRETTEVIIHNSFWYDLILTTNKEILDNVPHAVLFPYGTTWLNKDKHHIDALGNWDESLLDLVSTKKFSVSFLTTGRRYKDGYELRKNIWNSRDKIKMPTVFYSSTRDKTNIIGYSNTLHDGLLPNDDKINLFSCQFSIAIESTREESYFTEKLIDCLLTKTVPVYWGAPNIGEYFDTRGMIIVENYDDMISKLNSLDETSYEKMKLYIEENYNRAKEYGKSFFNRIANQIVKSKQEQEKSTDCLWTIGILTIEKRANLLYRLIEHIKNTCPFRYKNRIEIIINNQTNITIGEKRNIVLNQANGKYFCFIDDDDLVSPSYITRIADILSEDKYDGVGFYGKYFVDDIPKLMFKHSAKNKESFLSNNNQLQNRPLNHLNPVRTNIVKQIKFMNISYGEDANYCDNLNESGLIKNSIDIDNEILYYYYYVTKK